jgi:hypothetical protein
MVSEQHDAPDGVTHETGSVALSFVGGFVGTVTGLKRGNLSGAVVGGFVGGTVGYLAGASSKTIDPAPGSERADPILIDVDDADADDDAQEEAVDDEIEEAVEDGFEEEGVDDDETPEDADP